MERVAALNDSIAYQIGKLYFVNSYSVSQIAPKLGISKDDVIRIWEEGKKKGISI